MNPATTISVIITNFNHAAYLKQRIDSVLDQAFPHFEVIILDDCSTDNSKEIIEQYRSHPRISNIIYNEKNSGSAFRQWQKGIELSNGKYIWIAESDDYSATDFLEKMVSILEEGAGVAYCRSARVENDSINMNYFWPDSLDPVKWKKKYFNSGLKEISEAMVYRNTIPNASGCVFRREVVHFSDDILKVKFTGDWLFWINALRSSSVGYLPEVLNFFRAHGDSSRSTKSYHEEKLRFKEYFYVIKKTKKILNDKIKFADAEKYAWIFKELKRKRKVMGFIFSYFPPMPFRLLLLYYKFLLDKKQISK